MNLISVARSHTAGREFHQEVTNDEIELYLAYLLKDVTSRQCAFALGRSRGYFMNWCRRCANQLWNEGRLKYEDQKRHLKAQPLTYEKFIEREKAKLGRTVAVPQ